MSSGGSQPTDMWELAAISNLEASGRFSVMWRCNMWKLLLTVRNTDSWPESEGLLSFV